VTEQPWAGPGIGHAVGRAVAHTAQLKLPMIRPSEPDQALWTGRLDIDLTEDYGQRIGTVEIVVRIDIVTLWFGNRTLAVIDRDSMREWLIHPARPLVIDDVVWISEAGITYLSIDYSPGYPVAGPLIDFLVAVL
jgi:hypothetical protein